MPLGEPISGSMAPNARSVDGGLAAAPPRQACRSRVGPPRARPRARAPRRRLALPGDRTDTIIGTCSGVEPSSASRPPAPSVRVLDGPPPGPPGKEFGLVAPVGGRGRRARRHRLGFLFAVAAFEFLRPVVEFGFVPPLRTRTRRRPWSGSPPDGLGGRRVGPSRAGRRPRRRFRSSSPPRPARGRRSAGASRGARRRGPRRGPRRGCAPSSTSRGGGGSVTCA